MIQALERPFISPFGRACLFGLVALLITALPTHLEASPFNNYVVLANAFLHHHVWIDWPNEKVDAVLFAGKHFVVNDPVPSLLLLPYVAIAGLAANQTLLGGVLAFVAAAAAWRIAENLAVPLGRAAIVCAFMFAGTDLWWTAVLGDVWFLAQTTAVAFTLLALMELSGRKPKGWLVAFYYTLAMGSRFTLVMALPVMAYFVYLGNLDAYRAIYEDRMRRLLSFCSIVAAYGVAWMGYNFARWGVVWDAGHTVFYHEDVTAGSPLGSPFGVRNLPYQIRSFFLAPPFFRCTLKPSFRCLPPYIVPSLRGTALTWTSPALLFAVWGRQPWQSVRALWLATILVAAPSFLYYVNGYTQYGMRHALDFEPFLFVLMLLAAREHVPPWAALLVAYSIMASCYGVWFWVRYVLPYYR
jgi:hypothetical protein